MVQSASTQDVLRDGIAIATTWAGRRGHVLAPFTGADERSAYCRRCHKRVVVFAQAVSERSIAISVEGSAVEQPCEPSRPKRPSAR
jgi:hypothetical protein